MCCSGASRRRPSRRSVRLGSVRQCRPEFKSVLDLRRRHAGTQPWAQVIQAVYSAAVSIQIVEKRLDARARRGRHCHQSAQHLRFGCGVHVGDGSLSTRRQPRISAHVVSRVAPHNRVARGDVETIDDCDHGLCARRPLRAFLLELRRLVAGALRRRGGCKRACRHRKDGSADGTGECLSQLALSDAHRQRHGAGWLRHQQDHSYQDGCFYAALPCLRRRQPVPGRCRHSACARGDFPNSPSMGDYPVATRGILFRRRPDRRGGRGIRLGESVDSSQNVVNGGRACTRITPELPSTSRPFSIQMWERVRVCREWMLVYVHNINRLLKMVGGGTGIRTPDTSR